MAHICKYCNHSFKKESTLVVHICEQKRRAFAKDEKHVRIAFEVFQRFYKKAYKTSKDKTYEEFCKNKYYTAFVKVGSFISNVNPLYPDQFIEYIISSGEKLDNWYKDEVYSKYIIQLLNTEPVEVALERSINTMITWAVSQNSQWDKYFLQVSASRAVFDIKDGKISPWLFLNCKSGQSLLERLDDMQLTDVSTVIDIQEWLKKFKLKKDDMNVVKLIVMEGNL